ncbi:MAG: hypothetical protein K8S22_15150, partial [Betaproteobacteria bacterium]|nr:hypothetical protein [Betaproteobacteria bacterium]
RIARNALTDHFRRQRPEQAVEDDDLIFLAGGAPDPEIEAVSGFRDCVRKAFAAFGEAFRVRAEVLMLVAVEGWDMKELATMLGRTEGATREYVSQCRQKARPFFEPCL